MKLRKQHKSAASLPGFKDLRPEDKARVIKYIGWSEEDHDTSDSRNNNRSKESKTAEPVLPVVESPQQGDNSGKSTTNINQVLLMKLELEDKEAEARLAEAELLLAETRVKVENARRAVSAQKLKMAQVGIPPTS
ncbi:hypothetical protein FS837_012877 [Tulasnella sp. UAMH 9824]|nr:hypothetical protein FS837_012877 [Tulasnella sp. UAMH 9824]